MRSSKPAIGKKLLCLEGRLLLVPLLLTTPADPLEGFLGCWALSLFCITCFDAVILPVPPFLINCGESLRGWAFSLFCITCFEARIPLFLAFSSIFGFPEDGVVTFFFTACINVPILLISFFLVNPAGSLRGWPVPFNVSVSCCFDCISVVVPLLLNKLVATLGGCVVFSFLDSLETEVELVPLFLTDVFESLFIFILSD